MSRTLARALLALGTVLAAIACACGAPPRATGPASRGGPSGVEGAGGDAWQYVIDPPVPPSHELRVEATFAGATRAVAISDEARAVVRVVEQRAGSEWKPASKRGDVWTLDGCDAPCTVRYAIDLAALAKSCGQHLDCAIERSDVTFGTVTKWLLVPSGGGDAAITLKTRVAENAPFALGMRPTSPDRSSYAFRASELREGSYTAFGPMRVSRLARTGAFVDVVLLGAPSANAVMKDDDLTGWVGDATLAVEKFFGRFPVDATVFVMPIPGGQRVRFGSVMALTGASVVVLAGDAMPRAKTREDWVLVHELFHLGAPTFWGEGRWLEEGLATYYEPILRTRAGWLTERDLWSHFAEQMKRGMRGDDEPRSIEERHDIDSTYWGGALFVMLADVRIRVRTGGAKSFDDVMRAALAKGGDVTHVWKIADLFRFGDEVTGTTVLAELHEKFAMNGEKPELDALFADLGVARSEEGVALKDDAKLAGVRRAISR